MQDCLDDKAGWVDAWFLELAGRVVFQEGSGNSIFA